MEHRLVLLALRHARRHMEDDYVRMRYKIHDMITLCILFFFKIDTPVDDISVALKIKTDHHMLILKRKAQRMFLDYIFINKYKVDHLRKLT